MALTASELLQLLFRTDNLLVEPAPGTPPAPLRAFYHFETHCYYTNIKNMCSDEEVHIRRSGIPKRHRLTFTNL